jgi:hypothetical protein
VLDDRLNNLNFTKNVIIFLVSEIKFQDMIYIVF